MGSNGRSYGKAGANEANYVGFGSKHNHEKEFHGCPIRLEVSQTSGMLRHLTLNETTLPTVRSYKDGIKVGCTFLTTEGLRLLSIWHEDFLKQQSSQTHQN